MTAYEIERQLRAYGRMRESKYSTPSAIGARPGMPRQAHKSEKPSRADRLCWMIDIERALARLPEQERLVVEVHLLEKRSLATASFILARSIRTVARLRDSALALLAVMPEFE